MSTENVITLIGECLDSIAGYADDSYISFKENVLWNISDLGYTNINWIEVQKEIEDDDEFYQEDKDKEYVERLLKEMQK